MEQPNLISHILTGLTNQANQVYFVFDPQSKKILFLNPAFSRVWEYTPKEVMENPGLLIDSIHTDDKQHIEENYEAVMAGEQKQQVECKIITPSGTEKWISISTHKVTLTDDAYFIAGTVEDITNDKSYINNLQKFAAKKNSVLEILSHDLAGPLNILQSIAGLIESKVKPYANEEINHLVELMISSCQRNVKLIREFVANEFLESSAVMLNKQRINIIERFKQIIEEYKNAENAISKIFNLTYSSDPLLMDIDDVKFMQIINNLISNAIKFTDDNGVISIAIEERESTVLFTVADNGIGIPAHLQPVLFDKFSKARRPGLRGEESTGLGMSIIRNLVTWHNGKIWFESEENKGSVFYIELPKE